MAGITDEELDAEVQDECGGWDLFPALWSHFGDFNFIVQEKELIIWKKRSKSESKKILNIQLQFS